MQQTMVPKRKFDLEERTTKFTQNVRSFIRRITKKLTNTGDCKQLLRSSGSVGANYIEANEAMSKADFIARIKICRKEAKESAYWLQVLDLTFNLELESERKALMQEARELTLIFAAILRKTQNAVR